MNQHKFAFRVGVLVLLIAVMAGVFSVRLHNVQITQRQRPRREPRQL